MRKYFVFGIFIIYCSGASAQSIDQAKSKVEFKVGNLAFMSVSGTIKGMKGIVNFDAENLKGSSFDVIIDPASINTNNNKRDQHLIEEDFFNVAEYLTIRFVSAELTTTSDGFLAEGSLSLLGVTRNIAIPFTVSVENGTTTLSGEIEIDRDDYQLGTDKYGGGFVVGSTVQVKITCTLNK